MDNMRILFSAVIMFCAAASWAQAPLDTEKTARFHRRMMDIANPLPAKEYAVMAQPMVPVLSAEESTNSAVFEDINVIIDGNDPFPTQNESSIAVNPRNPNNIIAAAVDYRANGARWVYVSHNAGRTWENLNLGYPFVGWTGSNDPSVAFAADGTGYLMYGGFGNRQTGNPENGVFLARTTDEGRTWKSHLPVILHRGQQSPDSNFEDKYYIHSDNSPQSPYFGRIYTPWKRVLARDSSTQIVNTYSDDKGESWSIPLRVSERLSGSSEDTTFGQSFPLTITGPGGEVYVFWNYGPKKGIGFARSADGAKTFTEPRLIQNYSPLGVARPIPEGVRHTLKGMVRAESYPSVACDIYTESRKGWLYLSWAADNPPNVYFSRSTDRGDSWTAPQIVHSDTLHDQFWQWLAVDPVNGDLAIMYLDSRNDPKNILTSCYISYSSNGGDTWTDERASDAASDLRRNPFQGNAFAGDYSGCAFYDGKIYPSWVDMRNTKTQLAKNDVYTAFASVLLPKPPGTLTAAVIADNPTALDLEWTPPTSRAFGGDLTDYIYVLSRNDVFIKTFPKGTESFRDSNLEPYAKYNYTLRVVAEQDTSAPRRATAFSGGARLPGTPVLERARGVGEGTTVSLRVQLPRFREDSITPLTGLKEAKLYRDNVFVRNYPLESSAAGTTVELEDVPPTKGWYWYRLSVADAANESQLSDSLLTYAGAVETSFFEDFEQTMLPKYFVTGTWGATSFAYKGAASFDQSPGGKYRRSARDAFMIFPVRRTEIPAELRFWHAALVHPNDSAVVEYSQNYGQTWTLMGRFNNTMHESWNDGSLNAEDWKEERYALPTEKDTTIIRFRFWSNLVGDDDGWYIDNISISGTTSVLETNKENEIRVYPVPAASVVSVYGMEENNMETLNIFGEKLTPEIHGFHGGVRISVRNLAAGIYYIRSTINGAIAKIIVGNN